VVAQTLQEASDALGEDVAKLIHEGPKEALALTTNTQPVMLVAGVAAYRVWMAEVGQAPSAVAGHSLGEYTALVAAGSLTLAQAAPLVRLRAQAMQDAVPVGWAPWPPFWAWTRQSGCWLPGSDAVLWCWLCGNRGSRQFQ
jgi:[acyl-carrier-protein] S-malonyltransferase